jgi:hypothetical protein
MPSSLAPVLTPHGLLRLEAVDDDFPLDDAVAKRLAERFARGGGHGLLQLGIGEAGSHLPPTLAFWRDFAMRFVAALCGCQEAADQATIPAPPADELAALIDEAPPMQGGEYLRPAALEALWRSLQQALDVERADSGLSLQDFLKSRDSRWQLVGRVHFNLAENRKDPGYPFAFLATYTPSLAAKGDIRRAHGLLFPVPLLPNADPTAP